jgi:hypothetical protein
MHKSTDAIIFSLLTAIVVIALANEAQAVPSFARQVGVSCFACHTVYPELTPFGRDFKLNGYVMSKSKKSYEFPPPISGMIMVGLTHTDSKLPAGYYNKEWSNRVLSDGNDVLGIPNEASIFYAGRIYGPVGAFIQGTYEGDANSFALDMTDIRFAKSTTLAGKNLVYGITVNNSPTLQDIWNSTPSWGYPFESSEVAPSPSAGPVVLGALDQQVGGFGIYGFWNNLLYAGFTAYLTAKSGIVSALGAGTETEMVLDNFAAYWRVALQHQWGAHYVAAGTYGIVADIFPDGRDRGPSDRFTDIAIDAQYQYLADKYSFSVATTWIHEEQDRNASFILGETANAADRLDTFKINLNYYYQSAIGRIGGSAAYFTTTGTADQLLYAADPVEGSRSGSPDSNGFILEADYLPLDYLKLALQYTMYNKFNGSHTNYDGFGRNASDNNTLYFSLTLLL